MPPLRGPFLSPKVPLSGVLCTPRAISLRGILYRNPGSPLRGPTLYPKVSDHTPPRGVLLTKGSNALSKGPFLGGPGTLRGVMLTYRVPSQAVCSLLGSLSRAFSQGIMLHYPVSPMPFPRVSFTLFLLFAPFLLPQLTFIMFNTQYNKLLK